MLFATIVQAVFGITYRKRNRWRKIRFLRAMQLRGYWLMDAVHYPINRIGGRKVNSRARERFIKRERFKLLRRIAKLASQNRGSLRAIVLIKNIVYQALAKTLRHAGYNVPQPGPIGFPRWHRDPATIDGIRTALQMQPRGRGSK